MSSAQLGIPGIGQQKAKLSDWKKENKIYTHHAPHMEESPWIAWDEFESPHDYDSHYDPDSMGFGKSEKEAITDFCTEHDKALPFWWS